MINSPRNLLGETCDVAGSDNQDTAERGVLFLPAAGGQTILDKQDIHELTSAKRFHSFFTAGDSLAHSWPAIFDISGFGSPGCWATMF